MGGGGQILETSLEKKCDVPPARRRKFLRERVVLEKGAKEQSLKFIDEEWNGGIVNNGEEDGGREKE